MEVRDKSVMVLGGAGLVGIAVCRRLLEKEPKRLIVCSLLEQEVEQALSHLASRFPNCRTERIGVHGNLFVRTSLKDATRTEILGSAENRRAILEDVLRPLGDDTLRRSHLFGTLEQYQPDIVVDCVNTATALAYQDLYRSATEVAEHLDAGHGIETFRGAVERHLCTLYTPQLIRHIQILYEGLRRARTGAYVKIGTSGTGGMGLNIPYTHSEEKPSRVLLSKTAMAGAHSLLLFLMARTPDGPAVKEIKPTAAIAWKEIGFGPVRRRGRTIPMFDCPPDAAVRLSAEPDLGASREYARFADGDGDEVLRSVYIDTGENGVFSRAEFEVLTSLGQMEFVTPEEIAQNVLYEIEGINSGHDVINALDNACMGPTYRAGVLRHRALERLRELESTHGVSSVAFEMLGPPRLSKLLFEAEVLRKLRPTMKAVEEGSTAELSRDAERLVSEDARWRSEVLSIGIPVLLPDGDRLLRGPRVIIPTPWDAAEPTRERVDRWAEEGWVDLRPENFERWRRRFGSIRSEIRDMDAGDTSSHYDRPPSHWGTDDAIHVGRTVAWLFISEEQGMRMKA
jgi:hypothetical protein